MAGWLHGDVNVCLWIRSSTLWLLPFTLSYYTDSSIPAAWSAAL